jgi:hypothetical protein
MTDLNQALNVIEHSEATKAKTQLRLKSITPEIAFKFWDRLHENCRSILILIQSGYTKEALAVQRLSIENFAYAVALLQGKLTEQKLKDEMDAEIPKQAKMMHRNDERDPTLTPANREKLSNFLKDTSTRSVIDPGINTYNALDSCGLGFFYTKYRLLSINAAHATLCSATGNDTAEDITELLVGMQEQLKLVDAIALNVAAHPESNDS